MFVRSVQVVSRLDNQSKFQMLTQFTAAILVFHEEDTNMAAPYWAL